ncbi:MAG: hypothetical protein RR177_00210 [Oscillospiraceae bacterium]
MEKILNLNGKWQLFLERNENFKDFAYEISNGQQLENDIKTKIDGMVPGNFELDMQAAGLIGDLFFGSNSLMAQELENYHLWYLRRFNYSSNRFNNVYFDFEGIDTVADIYLNGNKIGHTDNMLISHKIKAQGIKEGENELMVHIIPTFVEERRRELGETVNLHQSYNAASLSLRKAPHSYGWDIMPRILSGGLWRDVILCEEKEDYIDNIYMATVSISEEKAVIIANYSAVFSHDFNKDYSLLIVGDCGNHHFENHLKTLWHNQGGFNICVPDPQIWYPRDMGEPNLYKITATLLYKGEAVDTMQFNFGIRMIELERTMLTDKEGTGEFCFHVNGEKLFVRGTNWVALDAFHSRDAARLDMALQNLWDSNCNMVRCWGGNVYEDHPFFDFCDSHGILVWQDFAMSCGSYPQQEYLFEKIKEEAEHVVKKLRLHPSIALWAGDNECDVATAYWSPYKQDPNGNKITREILPMVIRNFDPHRDFLPSSPFLSPEAFKICNKSCECNVLPEDHLWGPRDYFKSPFYCNSNAHFASETGYHGCPSPESLKKFLSADKMWPWQNNEQWQLHATCMERGNDALYAYRLPIMSKQVEALFGNIPDNIVDFSLASQISQGEAMKFFIERFRMKKWRMTGIIWWNLMDGWPQFSEAAVDYYNERKLGFYMIKRSQEPICLMMREPDENGNIALVGANEYLTDKAVKYAVEDFVGGQTVLEGEIILNKNSSLEISDIHFQKDETHFYLITWECDGKTGKNHYVAGSPPYSYEQYVGWLEKGGLMDNIRQSKNNQATKTTFLNFEKQTRDMSISSRNSMISR